jgi:flagellar export protein FliJ
MRKFQFPLQPLLTLRRRLEDEAKNAFLNKQAEILELEALILGVIRYRSDLLATEIKSLADHQALEARLLKTDDDERMHRAATAVLRDEAERLRSLWIAARQELEAVLKLREKAHAEWLYESEREEQAQLDEWTSQREARKKAA